MNGLNKVHSCLLLDPQRTLTCNVIVLVDQMQVLLEQWLQGQTEHVPMPSSV